jgi:pilus assembly protein Flp/PilA
LLTPQALGLRLDPYGDNGTRDKAMLGLIIALMRNTRAGTAIEYGLIAALVVIGMITALTNLADVTIGMWSNITNNVQHAN